MAGPNPPDWGVGPRRRMHPRCPKVARRGRLPSGDAGIPPIPPGRASLVPPTGGATRETTPVRKFGRGRLVIPDRTAPGGLKGCLLWLLAPRWGDSLLRPRRHPARLSFGSRPIRPAVMVESGAPSGGEDLAPNLGSPLRVGARPGSSLAIERDSLSSWTRPF